MVRFWIKSWVLVEDHSKDVIPTVEDLQKEAVADLEHGLVDGVHDCHVLEVRLTDPLVIGEDGWL